MPTTAAIKGSGPYAASVLATYGAADQRVVIHVIAQPLDLGY
jgi:hypothetical protein